jgi:flavin-dependent dehydrogenase
MHGAPGFQVDRGRFDQLLLDAAKEVGVRVLQPARAFRPRPGEDGLWDIPFEIEGKPGRIRAAYLVDACGRRSVLAARRSRSAVQTLALYAYWRDARPGGAETRVEAGADEWFWGAPLPDGTFNATAFIDPSRCRRSLAGAHKLETFYRSLLAGSVLLRGCLDRELASRVFACDASTYIAERPADRHSIKVGEASFAIDPLSSQGVQAAMTSALHGSIVAHTLLTQPENSSAAIQFYCNRQTETAAYHRRLAMQHYSEQHSVSRQSFWRKRSLDALGANDDDAPPSLPNSPFNKGDLSRDSRFMLSLDARLEETPCVTGDLIRDVVAVAHPSLERPVAFVKDIEVAPLLRVMARGGTVVEILRRWSPFVSPQGGLEIIDWMHRSGVIVRINN